MSMKNGAENYVDKSGEKDRGENGWRDSILYLGKTTPAGVQSLADSTFIHIREHSCDTDGSVGRGQRGLSRQRTC